MSQLEDLLQQCTVKLILSGRHGTGFFVTPKYILTCAHVVKGFEGQLIQVQQNQKNWAQAVVERSLPEPYDLALLRIQFPLNSIPPCVYLGTDIQSRDPLYTFGYPDEDFPNGCPVTFSNEGLTGDEPALIKFALGQVRPGMSGSPLLNQRTGKVCGIIKFTRDRSTDLGGGAITTEAILAQFAKLTEEQQLFHQSDQRWWRQMQVSSDEMLQQEEQAGNLAQYRTHVIKLIRPCWKSNSHTDREIYRDILHQHRLNYRISEEEAFEKSTTPPQADGV